MDTDKRVVTPRTFLYCFYCKTCDVSSFTYQYKLSRRAFFDCDKFIPNKTQRSSNYSPQTPPTKSLPHTHEFIGAYFIQISPPPGDLAFPRMIQMRFGPLQANALSLWSCTI